MNIQLTISLLVSDRMATLGRCLSSLKPLLKELDSELIIVYTGQNPETLELARQYTSHIIPFTWVNAFARARNAGLRAARGEWFLYIDDDEWFEDVDEILYFFKSDEYQKYQSAFYIQRNYTNWEGSSYADAYVGRMCRRLLETRFVYPIHENIKPYPEPSKKFETFVHHFGYAGKKNMPPLRRIISMSIFKKHIISKIKCRESKKHIPEQHPQWNLCLKKVVYKPVNSYVSGSYAPKIARRGS